MPAATGRTLVPPAPDIEQERAAVVAFLRGLATDADSDLAGLALEDAARSIDHGEHVAPRDMVEIAPGRRVNRASFDLLNGEGA